MYDARIGRFLSPDPMGQFWSPYVAMGNNPIIGIDPTGGECPTCLEDFLNAGGQLMDEVVVTATSLVDEVVMEGLAISADVVNSQLQHQMLKQELEWVQDMLIV